VWSVVECCGCCGVESCGVVECCGVLWSVTSVVECCECYGVFWRVVSVIICCGVGQHYGVV